MLIRRPLEAQIITICARGLESAQLDSLVIIEFIILRDLNERTTPQLRKIENWSQTHQPMCFLTMTSFQTIGKKFIEWFDEEDDERYVRFAALIVEQLTSSSNLPEDHPCHPHNRYTDDDAAECLYNDIKASLCQERLNSLRNHFFKDHGMFSEEVVWLLCAFQEHTEGDPNWDGPWLSVEPGEMPEDDAY